MINTNTKQFFLRIDKKQLINQLRAMQDNYIELWVNPEDKQYITLKDRYNINQMKTKN